MLQQNRPLHLLLACAGMACLLATAAQAEVAWIKDELSVSMRSHGSPDAERITTLHTGDRVEVVEVGNHWTKIRTADHGDGWIPKGYLRPHPPATLDLEAKTKRVDQLEDQVETLTRELTTLRESTASFTETDATQKATIDELTRENYQLRAGQRWPEMIVGAGILTVGMIVGAILRRSNARRQPRIRI